MAKAPSKVRTLPRAQIHNVINMRKKVKDLNETEFLALIESGKFRIKTEEELLAEGWEYAGCELEHEDEEVSIDVDILELSTPLTLSDIEEVDTSDSSFRVDLDCLTNCWFPMSIIEYSDFGIDPIVLDIPNEEDLLLV